MIVKEEQELKMMTKEQIIERNRRRLGRPLRPRKNSLGAVPRDAETDIQNVVVPVKKSKAGEQSIEKQISDFMIEDELLTLQIERSNKKDEIEELKTIQAERRVKLQIMKKSLLSQEQRRLRE